jgi:hypothetical protein
MLCLFAWLSSPCTCFCLLSCLHMYTLCLTRQGPEAFGAGHTLPGSMSRLAAMFGNFKHCRTCCSFIFSSVPRIGVRTSIDTKKAERSRHSAAECSGEGEGGLQGSHAGVELPPTSGHRAGLLEVCLLLATLGEFVAVVVHALVICCKQGREPQPGVSQVSCLYHCPFHPSMRTFKILRTFCVHLLQAVTRTQGRSEVLPHEQKLGR